MYSWTGSLRYGSISQLFRCFWPSLILGNKTLDPVGLKIYNATKDKPHLTDSNSPWCGPAKFSLWIFGDMWNCWLTNSCSHGVQMEWCRWVLCLIKVISRLIWENCHHSYKYLCLCNGLRQQLTLFGTLAESIWLFIRKGVISFSRLTLPRRCHTFHSDRLLCCWSA